MDTQKLLESIERAARDQNYAKSLKSEKFDKSFFFEVERIHHNMEKKLGVKVTAPFFSAIYSNFHCPKEIVLRHLDIVDEDAFSRMSIDEIRQHFDEIPLARLPVAYRGFLMYAEAIESFDEDFVDFLAGEAIDAKKQGVDGIISQFGIFNFVDKLDETRVEQLVEVAPLDVLQWKDLISNKLQKQLIDSILAPEKHEVSLEKQYDLKSF